MTSVRSIIIIVCCKFCSASAKVWEKNLIDNFYRVQIFFELDHAQRTGTSSSPPFRLRGYCASGRLSSRIQSFQELPKPAGTKRQRAFYFQQTAEKLRSHCEEN